MAFSVVSWLDGADDCGSDSLLGYWGIILWISLSIYIFIGLYVLCEEHFVPSLTILGEKLGLSADVCGATLMAAGSSSPELFTAVIGVFFYPTENPGPSTNCASAAFNMCIIVGFSVLFCGISGANGAELHSFPFIRDSFFYGIAALCLYVFYEIISPGLIELGESIGLVLVWVVYVVVLYYDLLVREAIVYIGRKTGLMTENAQNMILNTYAQLPIISGMNEEEREKFLNEYANSHSQSSLKKNKYTAHKTVMMGTDHGTSDDYDNLTDNDNLATTAASSMSSLTSASSSDSTSTSRSTSRSSSVSCSSSSDVDGLALEDDNNNNKNGTESDISKTPNKEVNFRNKKKVVRAAKAMNKKMARKAEKMKQIRAKRKMPGFSKDSDNNNEDGNDSSDDLTAMIENYYQDTAVFHAKYAVKQPNETSFNIDASDVNNDDDNNDENLKLNLGHNKGDASMYFVRTELTPDNDDDDHNSIKIISNMGPNTVAGENMTHRNMTATRSGTAARHGTEAEFEDIINEEGLWYMFKVSLYSFFHIVTIPFAFVFSRTIPTVNNNRENGNCRLLFAFIISIVWMAALTWLVVDLSNKIGYCLSLTPDVMGLTLLAIGSSVPDTFSSILVARQGKMGMAVSNALGSNVFDICICVGLSFFLKSLLISGEPINVESNLGFQSFIIALFVLLALFVGLLYWSNLTIKKYHGWILITAYIVFVIVFSVVLEEESSTSPTSE